MRKVTIGVSTIIIVILVFLSTALNVAAARHDVNYIDLESTVGPDNPGWTIDIIVNTQPVSGRWTIRGVSSGDTVRIEVKCIYENNYDPAEFGTGYSGYHWYSVDTLYDSDHTWTNWSIETYAGQSGYHWIYHDVTGVDPGTSIYVSWDIYVENYIAETSGEDDYDGYIDLTP